MSDRSEELKKLLKILSGVSGALNDCDDQEKPEKKSKSKKDELKYLLCEFKDYSNQHVDHISDMVKFLLPWGQKSNEINAKISRIGQKIFALEDLWFTD